MQRHRLIERKYLKPLLCSNPITQVRLFPGDQRLVISLCFFKNFPPKQHVAGAAIRETWRHVPIMMRPEVEDGVVRGHLFTVPENAGYGGITDLLNGSAKPVLIQDRVAVEKLHQVVFRDSESRISTYRRTWSFRLDSNDSGPKLRGRFAAVIR